jgi:hypothetical protein
VAQFRPHYPDVFDHRPALAYARAVWERMVHEGHPDNIETIRESLETARRDFNMGSSPRASGMRGKSTGIRAGHGSFGGGQSKVVWLSKDEKHMALARYPDVSPEDAYRRYAREIKPKADANNDGG